MHLDREELVEWQLEQIVAAVDGILMHFLSSDSETVTSEVLYHSHHY